VRKEVAQVPVVLQEPSVGGRRSDVFTGRDQRRSLGCGSGVEARHAARRLQRPGSGKSVLSVTTDKRVMVTVVLEGECSNCGERHNYCETFNRPVDHFEDAEDIATAQYEIMVHAQEWAEYMSSECVQDDPNDTA